MIQNQLRSWRVCCVTGGLLLVRAPTAFAHHGMDGEVPSTFFEGLLSGLAHPVIGVDHLAIVLLVGAFCGALRLGVAPVLGFVAASLLGCLLHVARLDLPFAEGALAVSLMLAGVAAVLVARPARPTTVVALVACGLLHGYAYGESIVGAEASPLAAYLIGFSLVQLALAAVTFRLAGLRPARVDVRAPVLLRALGAVSLLIGVVALF